MKREPLGRVLEAKEEVFFFGDEYAVTIDTKTGKELTRHPTVNGAYRFKAKLKGPKMTRNADADSHRLE